MKAVFIVLAILMALGAAGSLVYGIVIDRGGADGSMYITTASVLGAFAALIALIIGRISNSKIEPPKSD